MSFYSEMIKPLLGGVLKNLKSPDADEKTVEFLIGSVTDDKLWQLRAGYDDILFRIGLYKKAVALGAKGADYARFVRGGKYYKSALAAIESRFAAESTGEIIQGYNQSANGDMQSAMRHFKAAADNFSGEGAFCYGVTLLSDSAKDAEAAYQFRLSAESGYGKGMVNLALCYKHGAGIGYNVPLALVWLARGVLAGEPSAAAELAEIYKYGDGTDTDFAKALALGKGSEEERQAAACEIIAEYTE